MDILNEAKEIKNEIIEYRRELHRYPEVGARLPKTKEFVKMRLCEMGYEPQEICESGIVATISGKLQGRCIMLRADMDALNIEEKTNLSFKSENQNMHACGHDMHTAMLLGTAKILARHKSDLCGTVKLVFQPDEEGFKGAKTMIEAGVLENPKPEAALALHVHSGTPTGVVICGKGIVMSDCRIFRIVIRGKECHGAMPENGIDAINIAAHIFIALGEIQTREIDAKEPSVITIGKFQGGSAPNVITDNVVIEGTIRSFDNELSKKIFERIGEISKNIAAAFRGSAVISEVSSTPRLVNDEVLTEKISGFISQMLGSDKIVHINEGGMGSEDFAAYSEKIPSTYLIIGAGAKEEKPEFGQPMHNEGVVFNEDVLPIGAAIYANSAMKWLARELNVCYT